MWHFFRNKNKLKPTQKTDTNPIISTPDSYKEKNDGLEILQQSADFIISNHHNNSSNLNFKLLYFSTLVDDATIQSDVLPYLLDKTFAKVTDLEAIIPVGKIEFISDQSLLVEKLLTGHVAIQLSTNLNCSAVVNVKKTLVREISIPEIESNVFGPKDSFVESLDQNIHLIRKRLPIEQCIVEEVIVGSRSKTRVAFMYVEDIASTENVNTVRQRLQDIDFDQISDSSFISKFINDHTNTVFPQILTTERPDRANAVLTEGKIIILVDGSPSALITPATLINYLISFEDYYSDWLISSFLRLIRLFSVLFSISISAIYVAVVTYHYQLIPRDLLSILVSSRREIPFPPILEALILEVMIEVLREAGARLPTKIGQTIGIVGGIVIGTASVEAGLTSNVLLIIVAMSALASFTTPVYQMGNAIRLLRFPFLLFAHLWGLVGIALCSIILLAHLLQLTSLGRPYLQPFYPPRLADLKDTIIRLPFKFQGRLPKFLQTKQAFRFDPDEAQKQADLDGQRMNNDEN